MISILIVYLFALVQSQATVLNSTNIFSVVLSNGEFSVNTPIDLSAGGNLTSAFTMSDCSEFVDLASWSLINSYVLLVLTCSEICFYSGQFLQSAAVAFTNVSVLLPSSAILLHITGNMQNSTIAMTNITLQAPTSNDTAGVLLQADQQSAYPSSIKIDTVQSTKLS
jgi:hypothetical protein